MERGVTRFKLSFYRASLASRFMLNSGNAVRDESQTI